METIITLTVLLLLPLIPAFIIYKFLPSETVVSGPFKGLNLNLTGAFSGYFLLVLISVGVIYSLQNNKLRQDLNNANSELLIEKSKYQQWTISGALTSGTPEMTKIFIDGEYPKPSSTGKFNASLFIPIDHDNKKINLPNAVCFYNVNDGYKIVDLTQVSEVSIDSVAKNILLKNKIIMSKGDRVYNIPSLVH